MQVNVLMQDGSTIKARVYVRSIERGMTKTEVRHGGKWIKIWTFSGESWFQEEEK